ncbi:MAG: 3-keto-disaccharide hydrolase, partial [Planctomycetaceae bacterium]
MKRVAFVAAVLAMFTTSVSDLRAGEPARDEGQPPPGFRSLFNGQDLSGWKVPEGDGGHWRVVDGVIDYDARSEAEEDKNLWTEEEFGDFILMLDWRIKETTGRFSMPVVLQDGSHLKDAAGEDIKLDLPNADSGIYLRGSSKSQINIWCWPVGSGEVYGYRMDQS